jgi:Fe-S cluster assembly iron-binding protein IscA
MTVRMTEKAAEEFKAVCQSKSLPIEKTMLRVDADRNEEEGKYFITLKFDGNAPRQDDLVENTDGAQLVINKDLGEALGDVRLDYKESGQAGFVLERIR